MKLFIFSGGFSQSWLFFRCNCNFQFFCVNLKTNKQTKDAANQTKKLPFLPNQMTCFQPMLRSGFISGNDSFSGVGTSYHMAPFIFTPLLVSLCFQIIPKFLIAGACLYVDVASGPSFTGHKGLICGWLIKDLQNCSGS